MTCSPVLCRECGKVAFCSLACAAAARKMWHDDECLDASGIPLEPAMSGLSTECRVALRAFRRARRGEPPNDDGDDDDALRSVPQSTQTAEAIAPGANCCVTPAIGCDDVWAIGLGDLQSHCVNRPPRERDILETEAAVAAVLACADIGAHDCNGKGSVARSSQCGALAAEVVTALFKVGTGRLVCPGTQTFICG